MEPMEDGLGLLPLHAHHSSSYLSDHLPAAASPESDAETTSAPADAPVQIGDYVRMHWTDLIVDGGTQPCDMYSVPARVIADSAVGFTAESLFSESSTLGYTEYDYRFDDEKDWGRIKMGDMVPSSLRWHPKGTPPPTCRLHERRACPPLTRVSRPPASTARITPSLCALQSEGKRLKFFLDELKKFAVFVNQQLSPVALDRIVGGKLETSGGLMEIQMGCQKLACAPL